MIARGLVIVMLAELAVAQAGGALAASADQIHPRTMVTLGIGFGDQDVERNSGDLVQGIVSSSTEAVHLRLRGEHFFRSQVGFFVEGFIGVAEDIDASLDSPDSAYGSSGLFAAVAYRATTDNVFRMPVRFGPFFHRSEEDDSTFNANGTIERSTFGVRLAAEPELILAQSEANGRVCELSVFAEIACGAGHATVEDDAASEDAYAFTIGWELGLRYRFASGIFAGLSYFAQKYHVGATESYDDAVSFGLDDDISGVMITAGVRF